MIRGLLYIIVTIFVITFIRAVVGLIGKAVAQLFEPQKPPSAGARAANKTPSGGELVQCPGCGVYVSTETKLKKLIDGETRHFCSEACLKKYG